MKLFAFCFGVALAATAATAAGEAQKQVTTYAICIPEVWFLIGGTCLIHDFIMRSEKIDGKDLNPPNEADRIWLGQVCVKPDDTYPHYEKFGVCCGDAEHNAKLTPDEREICDAAAADECISHSGDCGQCVYVPPYVPEEVIIGGGGCCTNDCCNENLHAPLSHLDDSCDSSILDLWKTLEASNNDVFISPKVVLCSTESYPVPIKAGDTIIHMDCYDLCCPCCYNLDVTITDAAIESKKLKTPAPCPANGEIATGMEHYFARKAVNVYQGGAAICVKNDNIAIWSNHQGLIAVDSGVTYPANADDKDKFSARFSCSLKTDGGNSGYPNGTNFTNPIYYKK